MAITWQNITDRDAGTGVANALALKGYSDAGTSFVGGLDKLASLFTNQEAINQAAADRARNAQEQAYLTMLQGYKTPEELQAARMSGVLDQRLAALDPRIQAAVRGSAEARITGLQQQSNAANAYDISQRKHPIAIANVAAEVANSPITLDLARQALLHRQRVEPITNATAFTAANNTSDAENFKATIRPAIEAKAAAEATSGLNAANLANKLAPITNANAEAIAIEQAAALKDTAKGREVDAAVNKAVATYRQSGGSNDTETKANILRDLASQGYSAAQIARISPGLDLSLNTGPIAPIGRELSDFNSQIAKREAVQAQLENQYGAKVEPGNVGPLLKEGLAVIDGVLPKDSARSEIYKERLGTFLSKGGIKNTLKDAEGKPVLGADGEPIVNRVLPTAAQLQVIVSSIDKKWHNTRGGWLVIGKPGMQEEIDNALQAWADSPEAQKGAAELTKLELTKHLQTVRKAGEPTPQLPTALGGRR